MGVLSYSFGLTGVEDYVDIDVGATVGTVSIHSAVSISDGGGNTASGYALLAGTTYRVYALGRYTGKLNVIALVDPIPSTMRRATAFFGGSTAFVDVGWSATASGQCLLYVGVTSAQGIPMISLSNVTPTSCRVTPSDDTWVGYVHIAVIDRLTDIPLP